MSSSQCASELWLVDSALNSIGLISVASESQSNYG